MKKLLIIIFALLISVSFFQNIQSAHAADTSQTLSLSDAVLDDLALHNYLDYVSIYFKDEKSPNTITLNENHQWLPASTIKLFVALYAADQISKKNISLNQWVTIDEKNVVSTEMETSDYPVLVPGLTTTVDVLLEKMITQSDNTAYNTLLDLLDRQEITKYVQSIGLSHTIIGSKLNLDDNQTQYEYTTPGYNINTTTAADSEKAYELIDKGKVAGSSLLFNILSKQKIQNMIPALLPVKELTIAHKTGDLDPLYHDGGIIIGDNRHYILTIFTNLGNPNILAHLSQLIFTKNYQLVGADIPDKNTTPGSPQALDPLVMNPAGFETVLGATTDTINIPIPQITAADLGMTPTDLSLAIPDSKLPPVLISPQSPLHGLVARGYGLLYLLAPGEKNRQQVSLAYAKQLIADGKALQKTGNKQQASAVFSQVENVVHSVATDSRLEPDSQTQLAIKAVSDTQFAALKTTVSSAQNDTERIASLKQLANTVKDHIAAVEPHIREANVATAQSNKPLIGRVVDVKNNQATVMTSSGATITVPVSSDTKIITKNPEVPTEQAEVTPTANPSPTSAGQLPSPKAGLEKGQTIALLGTSTGKVFTPSIIVTNLHKELVAPQPVTVIKVNTKNNTMVVSENGNPVQVDLGPQTPIKGKDTNVPLQSIQPGSVVVIHGTEVQSVKSDSKVLVSPTQGPVPTTVPSGKANVSPTGSHAPAATSLTPGATSLTPAATSLTPGVTNGQGPSKTPSVTGKQSPTGAANNPVAPTSATSGSTNKPGAKGSLAPTTPTAPQVVKQTAAPRVINATSVQVVEQKPSAPQPAKSAPAQQSAPKQSAPEQPKSQAPQPPVQAENKDNKKGK